MYFIVVVALLPWLYYFALGFLLYAYKLPLYLKTIFLRWRETAFCWHFLLHIRHFQASKAISNNLFTKTKDAKLNQRWWKHRNSSLYQLCSWSFRWLRTYRHGSLRVLWTIMQPPYDDDNTNHNYNPHHECELWPFRIPNSVRTKRRRRLMRTHPAVGMIFTRPIAPWILFRRVSLPRIGCKAYRVRKGWRWV